MQIARDIRHDLPAGIVVLFVAVPLCLGIALASGAPLFSASSRASWVDATPRAMGLPIGSGATESIASVFQLRVKERGRSPGRYQRALDTL